MEPKKFTEPQMRIVSDLVQTYDIDPNDITFFTDDAEPFLGYETACVMLNRLVPNLADIDPEPLPPQFPDTVPVKVRLAFADGRTRAGLGVVNVNETDERGLPLAPQQLQYTALSRGLRSAMRAAAIDLMRLHNRKKDLAEFTGPSSGSRSNRSALLAQAHALGEEVGYIRRFGDGAIDKTVWTRILMHRYGTGSSRDLGEDLLADLVAMLRSIRKPAAKAAA